MSDIFLAGLVVGWVLGVLSVFVGLVALAWHEERMLVRMVMGEDDDDE